MDSRGAQKDQLLELFIQLARQGANGSRNKWFAAQLTLPVGLVSHLLEEIQKQQPGFIFEARSNDVPSGVWMYGAGGIEGIQKFLQCGGFAAIEEKENEATSFQRRKEETELRALELQIEDFPKARRERIITRWIAIGAAVISLVALVAQIVSK